MIKVIDIFAGPGGLGEGFSEVSDGFGNRFFDIVLSIEKERYAVETLQLRTFLRQFPRNDLPRTYYQYLRDKDFPLPDLYQAHEEKAGKAKAHCWKAELGAQEFPRDEVNKRIREALGSNGDEFVLIGGPPCQAYSLAGRSRNKGVLGYVPENDLRQRLYVEYLQILADHAPAAFVMENVKGILSTTLHKQRLFQRILEDLADPSTAVQRERRPADQKKRYRVRSLVVKDESADLTRPENVVVRSELYGIPQARHRVILMGIREDIPLEGFGVLEPEEPVHVWQALNDLPALRSGISKESDNTDKWLHILRSMANERWFEVADREAHGKFGGFLSRLHELDRGDEFVPVARRKMWNHDWYSDPRLEGVLNHSTRGHMKSDLHRYFFAACFAEAHGRTPSLADFPEELLPRHASVEKSLREGSNFADRFRVQRAGYPSTTIMSHISKDGHYYIHPDPVQCRSLTVREAARLQTFPDNYFFCGPRTAQYIQVGNAVPPLLARKIGEIVRNLLSPPLRPANGQDQQAASKLEHESHPEPGHQAGNGRAAASSPNGIPVQTSSEGSARKA